MAFPQKTSLPVALDSRSKQDISCKHVTTTNFMQFNVAYANELVPGQQINFHHELFTRLEPLTLPTFGEATIRNHAFWVPYRTIFPGWNDFYNDTPHIYSGGYLTNITTAPFITNSNFIGFLTNSEIATQVSNAVAYDFKTERSAYNFTPLGRLAYKILRTLGYSPTFNLSDDSPHCALPLLALMRVYHDWFYPSQYANDELSTFIGKFFTDNNEYLLRSIMSSADLIKVFKCITRLAYDESYFTSAWDNPNSPNDGLSSNMEFIDITGYGSVKNFEGPTQQITPTYQNGGITEYGLTALKALSDYMKRNQISGSRAMDRYYSRFGMKLTSEQLNRSVLINTYSQPLKFGDVTSTAETTGASLGSYAGKGISYGTNSYEVDTNKEMGMFIVISSVIPHLDYYQGAQRYTQHLSKTDFYTPEFDALGCQAISKAEVYVPMDGTTHSADYSNQVFGFTSRYAEYKVGKSLMTGDYILGSRNIGKAAWTLFRDLSHIYDSVGADNFTHSYDFITSTDADQYQRIFSNLNFGDDQFNLIHDFKIDSSFPGKSLFDTYEFENENHKNRVTVDINGTTIN